MLTVSSSDKIPDYNINIDWDNYINAVEKSSVITLDGRITKVIGLICEGRGLGMSIGSLCLVENKLGKKIIAEVIGFKDDRFLLMPYGDTRGISPGSRIIVKDNNPKTPVGENFLGRVIDGMGNPLDMKGAIESSIYYPLYGSPINPMERKPIKKIMDVGVCAINSMITIGQGQRIAIMAGSGVGKSVLMGMMVRHTSADVTIVGLIGERGREVKDFVEDVLGDDGMKKAVVIAATSDSPPLVRMRGAYLATTIAEYFRDQGKNVLLLMDSVTRFAMSSRDVGLAAGEPPTNRGYTPSFFAQIPVLLERAGNISGKGSITGIYTVLVEGDDLNDPVGDTVRSITDGHIVLSRDLANKGHYPSIEILGSVSRVMKDIVDQKHLHLKAKAVKILALYRNAEDMISIGAYVDGSNPKIDYAKKIMPEIDSFLKQDINTGVSYENSISKLETIIK